MLVDYDPHWPVRAGRLLVEVRAALAGLDPDGVLVAEHIGSTAVPDLVAKPIVDLQVQLPVLAPLTVLSEVLAPTGFVSAFGARPDSPGVHHDIPRPGMPAEPSLYDKRLFHSPSEAAILHIRRLDSPFAEWVLLLRDWLCAHPAEAARYGAHKRILAERFGGDVDYDDYTRAKTLFFDEIEPDVRRWSRGLA
ncbi:GrpB family protein [Nocardia salmonicida]|uniref:GrpB family protein n=1 Tax=Nocardia salmonicida TaxID=53431 RepID=UPI000A6C2DC0|nr:GrpB family protein [Nocardia salmonicida]